LRYLVDNTSVMGSILFEATDAFDIDFSVDIGDEIRTYGIGSRYSPADSDIDRALARWRWHSVCMQKPGGQITKGKSDESTDIEVKLAGCARHK
jgi:hypothetical protein